MNRIISLLLALLLTLSLCITATAEEDSRMKIISCPEQEFSTLCKPGYPWKFSERDGVTIYTEHENSIPYVLVYRSEDWIMDAENLIREQYTPYMQKKYGDDLVAVTEFDEYTLGGRPVSAALYTYKLQGYLIDMIRVYENVNGHTVSYTAKYIQGQGEATLAALDAAVQNYRPFADYYSSESNRWRYSIIPTEDGGTIFLFNEVFITIPADWAGKYDIKINERSISFYQSLSRSLWNSREGFEGGLLFSLGYSETEDFRNIPSYDELGKGSDGYYYLIYPTDYQAYQKIPASKNEYDAMWKEINYIAENSYLFTLAK